MLTYNNNQDTGLLPDFCDVRVIFMVVLLVELLALMLAMANPNTANHFWDHLAFLSLLLQWLGLVNAAALCLARPYLNRQEIKVTLWLSFALMMLVTVVICIGLLVIFDFLGLNIVHNVLGDLFLWRMLFVCALVYAVVLRYFYIQHQWILNLQAQSHSEVQALKARIRPHFLFNSMNTIASLISYQPDKAEKAVEDLADLFRASLQDKEHHTLGEELELTQSYLDIELLRLGERLQIHWDIDESLKEKEIPPLCLQPLAENAIYHGVEPIPDGGQISIIATKEDGKLVLSISNPVIEQKGYDLHKGNQMAQENIRRRLKLVYGNAAEFITNATKSEYFVSLKIPLE